jgi:hypothetical protein
MGLFYARIPRYQVRIFHELTKMRLAQKIIARFPQQL